MSISAIWRTSCRCIALLAITAAASLGASAIAADPTFTTRARAAVLLDADTGAVLYQHNADELMPPASVSKLMTAAVVFRALRDGKLKLSDQFTMSVHAWRTGGAPSRTSSMFVPIDVAATVDELLQGMIVQSGNDAAICLAEGIAGNEDAFAKRMTVEAHRIGLSKSTFVNPTGLYDPGHLMTAKEIAVLSRYIIKEYPQYYRVFSQKDFDYRKHKFRNRNPLIFMDIGADGLKTGHTKESGFNLAGTAVRDNKRLIAVVLGLPSENDRGAEAKRLLEWGFTSFAPFKLFNAGEIVGSARVWGGKSFYVPLTGGDAPVTVILQRVPENPRLRAEIVYNGPLKPPIKKGAQVAMLRVTSPTNTVNEVPLYAAEDVEPGGLMRRGLDSLAHLALSWVRL